MLKKPVVTANPKTGQIWTQMRDEDGNPLLDKNGEEYGFIRVSQPRFHMKFTYLNGGVSDISAIIAISKKAWDKVKGFYFPGMEVDGRVRIVETLEADLPGYSIKRAGPGEDAEVLTKNGMPIWRATEYVTDMRKTEDGEFVIADQFIEHENKIVRSVDNSIDPTNRSARANQTEKVGADGGDSQGGDRGDTRNAGAGSQNANTSRAGEHRGAGSVGQRHQGGQGRQNQSGNSGTLQGKTDKD